MQKTALRLRVATNLAGRIAELPKKSVVGMALASRATALLSESIKDIDGVFDEPCGSKGLCNGKAQCRY